MASTRRASKPQGDHPELVEAGHDGRRESALRRHVAFSQTDFTDDLKKITVPVLVMHGDDDQIVPYADAGPCRQAPGRTRDPEDLQELPARSADHARRYDQCRPASVLKPTLRRSVYWELDKGSFLFCQFCLWSETSPHPYSNFTLRLSLAKSPSGSSPVPARAAGYVHRSVRDMLKRWSQRSLRG